MKYKCYNCSSDNLDFDYGEDVGLSDEILCKNCGIMSHRQWFEVLEK